MAKKTPNLGGVPGGQQTSDRLTKTAKQEQRAQRSAEAAQELARRKKNQVWRQVAIYGGIVVVLAAIFTWVIIANSNSGSDSVSETGVPPITPAAGSSVPVGSDGTYKYGLAVGKPTAPHKVIIYEDFICPFCGEFETASHTGLAAAAAAGKVYIDYRPFHFLPEDYSAQALNAFFAVKDIAGNDVAKQFHDYLYAHQPNEEGPYPSLDEIANDANQFVPQADQSKVDDAIKNNSYSSWVDAATASGTSTSGADVQATPTVLLDGKQFQQGSTATDLGNLLVAAVNK
jgi:protein-disulfide isomerase